MNCKRIVVIGSSNTDMVVKATALPRPGETILGGTFLMTAGGKGANQAVAAARLGGEVTFVCKVGDDIFGQQARTQFANEGIDTSCIQTDPDRPSGVALITVDSKGENCIVVASGANGNLYPEDLKQCNPVIDRASLILMQLETPIETIEYVAQRAAEKGIRVVLNPAPAQPLPDRLLKHLYLLTPNETEAELISGIRINNVDDAEKAAIRIHEMGVEQVIVTLGSKGALLYSNGTTLLVPAQRVEAVDTTAAGDVFNGALVVALCEGMELDKAIRFGARAAAISVTRLGAQASIPYRKELEI